MPNQPNHLHENRPRSRRPVFWVVALDFILIASLLGSFFLFHHVIAYPLAGNSGTPLPSQPQGSDTLATEVTTAGTTDIFPTGSATWTDENGVKTYSSPGAIVMLTKNEVTVGGSPVVYYAADIRIKSVTSFGTAMAGDVFGVNTRAAVPDMAAAHNAVVAINGDYYSLHDGLCIRNGRLYRSHLSGQDVAVLYNDGTLETYFAKDVNVDAITARGAWQAWSFGPRLLDDSGQALTTFNTDVGPRNPRSAIGYYEPGHYVFVMVDGRTSASAGMTMAQLAQLFASMGCKAAYNFDGGDSAIMAWNGQVANNPSGGGRYSSDILYIGETP
ncbi:MAG: phosphodiester glycosidase family protein [Oscillospiraceae bacterium]|nr:phosphodiester glycosidase family protein [Oscillospiraceae bacterium]